MFMGLFGNSQTRMEVKKTEQPPVQTRQWDDSYSEPFEESAGQPNPQNSTVVTKGLTMSGALHGEGVVQIEGTLEGEVSLDGSLVVAETGLVKGPVTANEVRVAGSIQGSIVAHSHLWLERTGRIEGDVSTASLVVEAGGQFEGRCTMLKTNEKEQPISPPDSPLDRDGLDF